MRLSTPSTATLSLRRTSANTILLVGIHPIRSPQWHPTRQNRLYLESRSYSTPTPYRLPTLLNIKNIPAPHQGVIRILSLNRPQARNALSRQMVAELTEEVERVAEEHEQQQQQQQLQHNEPDHHMNDESKPLRARTRARARALIFTSNIDTCFCAGADLKERATFTHEQTKKFLTTLRNLYTSISNLPIPTISAISSSAFGGGLELALSTTFRVFAANAVLSLPETANLAIIPGAGGTYRLPALIGLPRATEMILTGKRLAGVDAAAWGLCERVVHADADGAEAIATAGAGAGAGAGVGVAAGGGVAAGAKAHATVNENGGVNHAHAHAHQQTKKTTNIREKVDREAITLALELCKGAPLATTTALRALRGWRDAGISEARAYEDVVSTRDRNEALAAFREKRRPVFEGR